MKELDSKIVRTNGHYERHAWLPGAREDLGEVVQGWTGTETFVKKIVVKPVMVFEVRGGEK